MLRCRVFLIITKNLRKKNYKKILRFFRQNFFKNRVSQIAYRQIIQENF